MHDCRLCRKHVAMASCCAAFRPLDEALASVSAYASAEQWYDKFFPQGRQAALKGKHCSKQAEPGSLTCADPHCKAIVSIFGAHRQTDIILSSDPDHRAKKQRERCWQLIHGFCMVGQHQFVGYFFYVCPCGAIPILSSDPAGDVCMACHCYIPLNIDHTTPFAFLTELMQVSSWVTTHKSRQRIFKIT